MSKIIIPEKHFHPKHTFECGQCFRWNREDDGSYTGVAHGRVINVSQSGDGMVIKNTSQKDYENIWKEYFDIQRDYGEIKKQLSCDEAVKKAIEYGWGIRILRQEFFECLISFIISANNNIPRIKGIVEKLSLLYGDKILYGGKTYYSFPAPERLYGIEEGDLAPLRAGYRARYIAKTVKDFENGRVSFEEINNLPLDKAQKALCSLCGVGPKVADCILLFSFGNFGAFPTDVWVKRVMSHIYMVEENKAAEKGRTMFGNLAGIAQQYLFYYMREREA